MRALGWPQNGIVVTVLTAISAVGVLALERYVAGRPASQIVVSIADTRDTDDEGDEDAADPSSATVPLYASVEELTARAQEVLATPPVNPLLYYELGRQARGFGAHTLADALLARRLEGSPRDVDALFLRARTQSDLGHPERAVQMYESVLVLSPRHQKATFNLGVLARRAGDLARAQALLAQAAAISSGRLKAKALHQLALTHGATGGWERAALSLQEAVRLRPDAARYWLDLGTAEERRGRLDEARAAYEKAVALNRRFADAHAALASLLEQQGNSTKALSHLLRAVRVEETNVEFRRALARLQLARGSLANAREEFAWLSQHAANSGDRAFAEAMLALLNQDMRRMLAQLRRAEALGPGGYDDGVVHAALALHEHNDREKARGLLATLVTRPSLSPQTLLTAASAAIQIEEPAQAEALLRRYLQARPESSEAWFLLGRALSDRGELPGAVEAYRQSIAYKPEARNARLNLAVLFARSGQEQQALALYDQLLEAHPRYAPALVNRARLHERAGRVAAAMADLEAALKLAPDDAEVERQLANLLLDSGHAERGRALLQEQLARNPADLEARLLLAEAELRAGNRVAAVKEIDRASVLAEDTPQPWARIARLYRRAGNAGAAVHAEARAVRRAATLDQLDKPSNP